MSAGFGGQISPPLNAPPAEPLTVGVAPGPNSLITTSNRVIIFGASGGQFVYTPSPAANTLAASSTGQAVTDPFGNHALAGQTSYTNTSTTPAAPPWTATNISGGGLTSYLSSVAGQNGTWTQQGAITFQAATSPQLVLPSGYTGAIAASQSDSSQLTANTTAITNLTKAWSVPANDVNANTVYRFQAWGNGTMGATSNGASWGLHFGTVDVIVFTLGAGAWAINDAAVFYFMLNIQFTSNGVSGNANGAGFWSLINTTTGNSISTSALVDLGNTVNTTIANTCEMRWQWATTTNAPSITGNGSTFERISG